MCAIQTENMIDPSLTKGLIEFLLPKEFLDGSSEETRLLGLKSTKEILRIVLSAFKDLGGIEIKDALMRFANKQRISRNDLESRNLKNLDPLVSDCACQVRAIELLIFEQKIREDSGFRTRILHGLECVHEMSMRLISAGNQLRGKLNPTTARTLLQAHGDVEPFLNEVDVTILVLSKMLSLVRSKPKKQETERCPGCGSLTTKKKEKTIDNVFSDAFGSSELSKKTIARAQGLLARMSCRRLLQLITEANVPLPIKERLTDQTFRFVERRNPDPEASFDEKQRLEMPVFLSVEALFQLAAAHKISILFKSEETDHCCPTNSSTPRGVFSIPCVVAIENRNVKLFPDPRAIHNGEPFLVISGFRALCRNPFKDSEERLRSSNLVEIIRMNAANHPQYTDEKDRREVLQRFRERGLNVLAAEIVTADSEGRKLGCVECNAQLFSTFHIYASSAEEEGILLGGNP